MKQGSLVKLPESKFWGSNKVGIVTETRNGLFFNSEDWVQKEESKIEFGSDFVWFQTQQVKVVA